MKVLYISGPFSTRAGDSDPYHSFEENIIRASKHALEAAKKGWAPFTPHKNTAGFQHVPEVSSRFWMEVCLEFVRRSDAILFLPGWSVCKGCREEYNLAASLHLPLYFAGKTPSLYVGEPLPLASEMAGCEGEEIPPIEKEVTTV